MVYREEPTTFECNNKNLVGILHLPYEYSTSGVVVVVGGPQYRVGSHRQFVLLARSLAEKNIPVFRFDYRGMGDSEGQTAAFYGIDDDIRSAIDKFIALAPNVNEIILWGLCDAASASIMYAHTDARIKRIIMLNPWVRTEQSIARVYLVNYYCKKIFSRDTWGELFSGKINIKKSLSSLVNLFYKSVGTFPKNESDEYKKHENRNSDNQSGDNNSYEPPYLDRMFDGFNKFNGKILIILSGIDYTADEFKRLIKQRAWSNVIRRKALTVENMPIANHTFSTRKLRDEVASRTIEWIEQDS